MRHDETHLHIAVLGYLDLALPHEALVWHTPNGERRDARTGARLMSMGVRAGFPDLCILLDGRLYCIELKAPGGRLSKVQQRMHQRLTEAGALVTTCYSVGAVEQFLTSAGIPTRARIAA